MMCVQAETKSHAGRTRSSVPSGSCKYLPPHSITKTIGRDSRHECEDDLLLDRSGTSRRGISQTRQTLPVLARSRARHYLQRERMDLMTNQNVIRIGDRIKLCTRGVKKTYVAEFWQDDSHRRLSLKTTNLKVATERATRIASELVSGTFAKAPAEVPISEAATDYIRTLEVDGRAKKTVIKYRGILRGFSALLRQHHVVRMKQITARHFDVYREDRKKIRHPKTVYTESVVVKQFTKWARTRKLIVDDPLAGIKLGKPARESKPVPSLDEVTVILAAAEPPLRDWLSVLAYTGMRVGELQRLRVEDVDLEDGWIHIVSRRGYETKTRTSRKVPIHGILRPTLEAIRSRKRSWFFTAEASKKFPDGCNWISAKKVNDRFARVVTRLGMKAGRADGYVVHSLRHFFETLTVNSGIPQRVIDTWLGHSSDKSMGAIYYRLNDADSQKFMNQVPFGTAHPAARAGEEKA